MGEMNQEGIDFLAQLPVELQCQIFAHVDFKDILSSLFVSKYFYNAIRYCSGGVSEVNITDIKGDLCSLNDNQTSFYLNLVTNKSKRPIQVVNSSSTDNDKVTRILSNYNIVRLHLSQRNSNILNFVESSISSFDLLKELKFGIQQVLDLNQLNCLAEKAPNLESLNITSCYGLRQETYTGRPFNTLRSLRINTVAEKENNSHLGASSYDTVINSLISNTTNLSKLQLTGNFFENDIKPFLSFSTVLPNLETLAIEVPQNRYKPDDIHHLPMIHASSRLVELSIKSDIYSHERPLVNPLNSVETLYFDGIGCIHALKYYGIGENIKRLYLKSGYEYVDCNAKLLEVCKKCPNVEELVVTWFDAPSSWISEVIEHCPKVRLISFNSILKEGHDYGLEFLSTDNSIQDIYINKKLPNEETNWLTNQGYNVYNGCGYGFHIFSGR